MATSAYEQVGKKIESYRDWIVKVQGELTATKALGPDNGGEGEGPKAELIQGWLRELGVEDIQVHAAPDDRLPGGRPNVIARIPGKDRSKTLWVMSHLDVVPAGDLKDWESDPWTVRVDGDRVYVKGQAVTVMHAELADL